MNVKETKGQKRKSEQEDGESKRGGKKSKLEHEVKATPKKRKLEEEEEESKRGGKKLKVDGKDEKAIESESVPNRKRKLSTKDMSRKKAKTEGKRSGDTDKPAKIKAPKYSLDEAAPTVDPVQAKKDEIRRVMVSILLIESKLPALTGRKDYHTRHGYLDEIAELKESLIALDAECKALIANPVKSESLEQMDNSIDQDKCVKCNIPLLISDNASRLACRSCGRAINYLPAINSTLPFGQEIDFKQPISERRKTFRKWIAQFYIFARPVPPEVITLIRQAFDSLHVKSSHEIRKTRVAKFIKDLKLVSWRNDADRITMILNNQEVPTFTMQQLATLLKMFYQCQIPYLLFKGDKTNFIARSQLVNRFCLYLGLFRQALCFPSQKSRKVVANNDIIIEKIFNYNGWTFQRTI